MNDVTQRICRKYKVPNMTVALSGLLILFSVVAAAPVAAAVGNPQPKGTLVTQSSSQSELSSCSVRPVVPTVLNFPLSTSGIGGIFLPLTIKFEFDAIVCTSGSTAPISRSFNVLTSSSHGLTVNVSFTNISKQSSSGNCPSSAASVGLKGLCLFNYSSGLTTICVGSPSPWGFVNFSCGSSTWHDYQVISSTLKVKNYWNQSY